MMDIEGFFRKYNIICFRKEKEFASKKNEVFLYEGWTRKGVNFQWIKKTYFDQSRKNKEYKILKHLKKMNVKVPDIYFEMDKLLLLEYIEGELLLERFERFENTNIWDDKIDELIQILLIWLSDFYGSFSNKYIMEDINFRNFIISGNSIFGLDFEDCCPGEIERDIGRISAFIITYNPAFSEWKKYFVKKFLDYSQKEFSLAKKRIKNAYITELKAIEDRRTLKIDKSIYELIY